jgi:hypothetical protein
MRERRGCAKIAGAATDTSTSTTLDVSLDKSLPTGRGGKMRGRRGCVTIAGAATDTNTSISDLSLDSSLGTGRNVIDNNEKQPPVRGISHTYRSPHGKCSQRSRVYEHVLVNECEKDATSAGIRGQRSRNKESKIADLKTISPCLSKAIPAASLHAKAHLFSNRTNSQHLPVNQFDIVDETDGCCLKDIEGKHIIFLLLPRTAVLDASGRTAYADIVALEKLSGLNSTERSAKRDGFFENNYSTTGVRANRGGHGIISCKFGDKQPEHWNRLIKMMKRCQGYVAEYLPYGVLNGLTEVIGLSEFKPPMPKVGESPTKKNKKAAKVGKNPKKKKKKAPPAMFAGLANAMNYLSPAHTDEDFFYSVFTMNVKGVLTKDAPSYSFDSSIIHYMCFPEYGVAVALRAGDVLLFNPQNYHCLSEKEVEFDGGKSADVYVTSFYLKTAVVCKNDNRIALTDKEEELYAAILQNKK